jgi:hypothetical protein
MSQLRIDLSDQRSAFQPGEELTGSASWQLERQMSSIELRLFWFTRGRGMEDAGVAQTIRFEQPLNEETRSFKFRLPDAPYSFSGKLISLIWALELVLQPSKEVIRRELVIGPGCREVQLSSVESECGKMTTSITWTKG